MTDASTPVLLEAFAKRHRDLLAAWLRQPHVARWYPHPDDDLARASDPLDGGAHAIVVAGGVAVGYLRWQRVDRATLDALGLDEIPAGSVDADILLADGACDRGLGPIVLELLLAELRADESVALVGLTTSVENTRAHRAFAKAGFHIARQYDPAGLGRCHLMLRDLRPERARDGSPSAITVRDAAACDPALARVLHERWGPTVITRGRRHVLATLPALSAERSGRLVGCLTYHLDGSSIEVVTLDALEERRGVGTALMHALRPRARRIWLVTTNDNLPAQAFYERLGMRLVARHADAIAPARRLKPAIPLVGIGGVPITDELEYEWPS